MILSEHGAEPLSAYELAVRNGYAGSESEWLDSLRGQPGHAGKSAYQIAVARGFVGGESEWLASLVRTRIERKEIEVVVKAPLLPARATFERDPESRLTTRLTVALSDGTGIAITPERDADGFMTAATMSDLA